MNPRRPKFLSLTRIRFPLTAVVSILHRISGVLLFASLPLLLWMLQGSLRSSETYAALLEAMQRPFNRLFLLVLLWAFLHHLCAGIRYLLIDIERGVAIAQARASSRWVLAVSLILTVWLGVKLW